MMMMMMTANGTAAAPPAIVSPSGLFNNTICRWYVCHSGFMDSNFLLFFYFHMYDLSHHIYIVNPSGFTDLHIRMFAQTCIGYPYDAGP